MPKSDSLPPLPQPAEALSPQQQELVDALGRAIVVALGDANGPRRRPEPSQAAKNAAAEYGKLRLALQTYTEFFDEQKAQKAGQPNVQTAGGSPSTQ